MKKKDLPAMPFYWGDWFKALDVQMLPRDIRCTWFEMLGRMWESKYRGELSINGQPLSIEQLAQLLGFGSDVKECEKHINYLEKNSLFSRKNNGVIYSRKLVKMEDISRKRSKAGGLGMSNRYNKTPNKHPNKSLTNSENENENENENKKGFIEPTIEDVRTYCKERKNKVDPEAFIDHYTANGWVQGNSRTKVVDWKACVRTWEKR